MKKELNFLYGLIKVKLMFYYYRKYILQKNLKKKIRIMLFCNIIVMNNRVFNLYIDNNYKQIIFFYWNCYQSLGCSWKCYCLKLFLVVLIFG